jgi:hypothetical protein
MKSTEPSQDTVGAAGSRRYAFKRVLPPPTPELPQSPYKGLVPFSEADAPFFFGRDAERAIIAANLRSSRLTILYGESGVGKTSVLRAGVLPDLRSLMRQNLENWGQPQLAVVTFASWRDNPAVGLARAVRETLNELLEGDPAPDAPITELLASAAEQVRGKLLIIFDQCEEYFLYHPSERGEGTFAHAFIEVANQPEIHANFLVSLREDALARLDVFQGEIPHLFDNYLRIDHLDVDAARSAIVQPVGRYNELAPDEREVVVEPELVEAVLGELRIGPVRVGDLEHRATHAADSVARIETPYLQLVMTRLWEEEMRSGSRLLRRATLEQLGGAKRILRTHLDEAMSILSPAQRRVAAEVFNYLVTPTGTKIAHTASDLAAYASLPEEAIRPVLERLSRGDTRVLTPVPSPLHQEGDTRFEIFHDVLAHAILDWRARYVTRHGPLGRPRGIVFVILMFSVTFGFYGGYWVFKTLEEMKQHRGEGLGGVVGLLSWFGVWILSIFLFFAGNGLLLLLGLAILLSTSSIIAFVTPFGVAKMYVNDGQQPPVAAWTGLWLFPGAILIIPAMVWFVKIQGALNRYWAGLAPAAGTAA